MKFLTPPKLKTFEMNVDQRIVFDFGKVENIVGKEKMLVTSIFSFSHIVFKSPWFQGCNTQGCVLKG